MKEYDEIRRVYERMANRPELLTWRADDFRFGLLTGKLPALGWSLGEESSGDLAIDYDFEGWTRELHTLGEDIRGQLNKEEL